MLDFALPPRGVLRASVLSGTCLTKDVNIYTPDGPVALGDLEIGDTVYSYSYDGRVVTGRITNIIEHDVKEIYEVTTCRSRRLIATGNHPVLIKDSGHTPPRWKKVEDLKPNKHSVVIATPDPTPVQELNEVITIDVARALGYFLADGWINRSKAPRPWKSWVLCINTKRETAKTELVKNIEKIGEDKVYDLTIEPYPHFIAEGIVVHNSMATPAAAGIAALMYESAWRQGVRLTPAMFKDMMASYGEFAGNKSNYYGWGVPTWDIWERYAREVIGISV
jgi:Ni,Fe-hydrogenase III small subunit